MTFSPIRMAFVGTALTICFYNGTANAQSYSTLAKRFADAPLVAHVKVVSAIPIKPDPAAGVARFYTVASVTALIRAPAPQPPSLNLLVDLPRDSQGKAQKLKKVEWLIAAQPAGAQVQLTAPPVAWTAESEKQVRSIIADASAAGAPGAVRRVSGAFYSPGNVPGESETQIFFELTKGGRGSLSVLRRPGIAPAWSASFGEVASDGPPPVKDSFGWYRLVCGLPATLPDQVTGELDANARIAATADYAFVIAQLGRCDA